MNAILYPETEVGGYVKRGGGEATREMDRQTDRQI